MEFVFKGVSDPDVYSIASLVMSTIQPHALDVEDAALMIDGDLNNTWGPNRHVTYGKIKDTDSRGITANMWDEGITGDTIKDINNWDALREDKIETYNLYVRALEQLGMNDVLLTLQYTDPDEELSFLTIESGEIQYDVFG